MGGRTIIRFKAASEDIGPPRLEIPIGVTALDLLEAVTSQTPVQLASEGRTELVRTAELRFQKGVDLTHQPLAKYAVARELLEAALLVRITNPGSPSSNGR